MGFLKSRALVFDLELHGVAVERANAVVMTVVIERLFRVQRVWALDRIKAGLGDHKGAEQDFLRRGAARTPGYR